MTNSTRTTTKIKTGPGWNHPADVCPLMAGLAVQDATDPAVIAWRRRHIGDPPDQLEAARRLLEATARAITYRRDPPGEQRILAPRHVIADGIGDCKKMSTLIASVAYGLGIPFRFAVVAQKNPDDPNHVWPELLTPKGWIAVDAVPRPLGLGRRVDGKIEVWEPIARKGAQTMQSIPVRRASGIPIRAGLAGCGSCSGCGLHGLGADVGVNQETLDSLRAAATSGDAAGAVDVLKKVVTSSGKDWEKVGIQIAETACAAGLAATGYGAVAAPLCKLIGPIWNAIKKWITVKISPDKDWRKALEQKFPAALAGDAWKRYLILYVGKDKARLDARKQQLLSQGLPPAYEWSQSYGSSYQWGSGKGTYYGAVWDRNQAPQALRDTWTRTDAKFARLAMLPAAQMQEEYRALVASQGGVASAPYWPSTVSSRETLDSFRTNARALGIEVPTTYAPDSIIGKAGPDSPFFPARDLLDSSAGPAPSPGTDVRLPASSSSTPAAGAGVPASSRQVTPPTRSPTAAQGTRPPSGLPTTARPVTPPLPAGSRIVSPPAPRTTGAPAAAAAAAPGGLTVEEASILEAIRRRRGVDIARRAARAAGSYFGVAGLGAVVSDVRLVDQETEGKIRATLPSTAAALAKKDSTGAVVGDLKTRAQQVNYGLSHIGEPGMDRTRAAERLMAYKRAAGDATPDSRINEAVRAGLARDGGFPLGAVPTLATIAAKLPRPSSSTSSTDPAAAAAAAAGMPAGSRQVSEGPGTPSTPTTSAGAATSAGTAPLDQGAAAAAGVPAGSTQIAPAPSKSDNLVPGLVIGYMIANR